jgi:SAM-dependent methyltransferase
MSTGLERMENERELSEEEKERVFEGICEKMPATLGSKIAWEEGVVYGEVVMPAMAAIFHKLNQRGLLTEGGVFYDLGSGIGKAVIAAALLHPFSKCTGIELLKNLHALSVKLQKKFLKSTANTKNICHNIEFVNGDIFLVDWSDASCFFANSTCFDSETMSKLCHSPLKPGTIGITTSKRLHKSQWRLLELFHLRMSWGQASIFLHTKR